MEVFISKHSLENRGAKLTKAAKAIAIAHPRRLKIRQVIETIFTYRGIVI